MSESAAVEDAKGQRPVKRSRGASFKLEYVICSVYEWRRLNNKPFNQTEHRKQHHLPIMAKSTVLSRMIWRSLSLQQHQVETA